MKRFVIVLVTICLIVLVCWVSWQRVDNMFAAVTEMTEAVQEAIDRGDKQAVADGVQRLVAYWSEEEEILIIYVRHAQIDDVTKSVSRLIPLTEYEDYAELQAELTTILWQVEHIWKSERMQLQNLL